MCTFDFEFWAIGARIMWGKGLPKNARDIPVRFCSAIHGSANFWKANPRLLSGIVRGVSWTVLAKQSCVRRLPTQELYPQPTTGVPRLIIAAGLVPEGRLP